MQLPEGDAWPRCRMCNEELIASAVGACPDDPAYHGDAESRDGNPRSRAEAGPPAGGSFTAAIVAVSSSRKNRTVCALR